MRRSGSADQRARFHLGGLKMPVMLVLLLDLFSEDIAEFINSKELHQVRQNTAGAGDHVGVATSTPADSGDVI